jgi:hypothetical protein
MRLIKGINHVQAASATANANVELELSPPLAPVKELNKEVVEWPENKFALNSFKDKMQMNLNCKTCFGARDNKFLSLISIKIIQSLEREEEISVVGNQHGEIAGEYLINIHLHFLILELCQRFSATVTQWIETFSFLTYTTVYMAAPTTPTSIHPLRNERTEKPRFRLISLPYKETQEERTNVILFSLRQLKLC